MRKLGNEVFEARKYIRSLGLLSKDESPLVSLSSKAERLDRDALIYAELALKNQRLYYDTYTKNEKANLPVMSFTEQTFDPIKVKLEEVTAAAQQKLASLREPQHSFFKSELKKKRTKEEMISFYRVLQLQCMTQLENELEAEQSFDSPLLFVEAEENEDEDENE